MAAVSSQVVIALGSNLGDSAATLRTAIHRLRERSPSAFAASSLWRSTPVDCPPGSPLFLNAVVAFTPRDGETPETLLEHLQSLEREFGRQPRVIFNEPRPLDLDLILFAGEVRSTPQLTLPHPRAHLRRFVIEPLCEIAPDLVLPGQLLTVRELLAGLPADPLFARLGEGT
jgi:2-amino-4-hydroxy-6-hydroxymethyldihydropteridine diphosphokinase